MTCHHHENDPGNFGLLWAGAALNLTIAFVELAGGLWAGSLALLADAAHNLAVFLHLTQDALASLAVVVAAFFARTGRVAMPSGVRSGDSVRRRIFWAVLMTGISMEEK